MVIDADLTADALPWLPVELNADPHAGAPACGVLAANEIHLWRADFDQGNLLPRLRHRNGCSYSAFERMLAIRRTARRVLCSIAASYLNEPLRPSLVWHDSSGQPRVRNDEIRISASHTGSFALFAIARDPIGVDVEPNEDIAASRVIARYYLAPGERERSEAQESAGPSGFIRYWTRKEAYLKALGKGLRHPPHLIDTSDEAGDDAVFNGLEPFDSVRWTIRSFRPSVDHIAAVAHLRARGGAFRFLNVVGFRDKQ